jgi:hypothetical protein
LEAEADALADNLNSPGPNGEVEVCVIHCVIVYSLYLICTTFVSGEPKAGLKDALIDSEGVYLPRETLSRCVVLFY